MCGICGYSGSFNPTFLNDAIRLIGHRGPDDKGLFVDEDWHIGLGHVRLSILDLSPLGHQPMSAADNQVAIVYNGEIYNYLELRKRLEKQGHTFRGHSDTEVLLHLYLEEGEVLLSRLNGIFAFALWDARKKSLFLARDGLGVKPLYYSENKKGFLFASELKALLLEQSVSKDLNYSAFNSYLRHLWCPAPDTPFKHVCKLPPGHALMVQNGRIVRQWQFYDLPYQQQIAVISASEAVREVESGLRTAIKRQMVADVEVGAFLSGGLDSSSVVAFAREYARNRKLQCFTIGFADDAWKREGMTDDLCYAERVARHLDVDLHTITVGPEMVEHLQTMIYHLDEPQADPAPINALMICQLAREHGIKVLLSGAGGDDIFTGYRRHYALVLEKYWGWLPKPVRDLLSAMAQGMPRNAPFGRRLSKAFQYAGLEGDARITSYFNWNTSDNIRGLFSQDLLSHLDGHVDYNPLLETLGHLPHGTHALNKMLYLEGKHFLADHNLNYTDKMSMAYGVEVRVPLLDPDLIALAARLPVDYKQKGREGKWIFKKAMEPYLPLDVIYRPKTGFGAPLRSWLRHQLKPVVEDVLSERSLLNRGLFSPKAVNQLLMNDRQGRIDGTYTIFSLISIELWCRIFLDQSIESFCLRKQ